MSSPDLIIRQAVRYLAAMPEHPATQRIIDATTTTALLGASLKDLLFANIRAIGISYSRDDYENMGELIVKRRGAGDLWGVSKMDADGDNMLIVDDPEVEYIEDDGTIVFAEGGEVSLSWGWVVDIDDFYIFSVFDALKQCWNYIKQEKAVITSCDIRNTYYG